MNIGDVHRLTVDARRLESEVAAAAENLIAAGDGRDILKVLGHGARIRQLLWDSRLPDTAYINTGRDEKVEAPVAVDHAPLDSAGLVSHLVRLCRLYGESLALVTREFDPLTHDLLEKGLTETQTALADLG